jgi:hypothetical protein
MSWCVLANRTWVFWEIPDVARIRFSPPMMLVMPALVMGTTRKQILIFKRRDSHKGKICLREEN